MLWKGNDKVGFLAVGRQTVAVLYSGAVKVWEAVSSCFGSGKWRPSQPWKGKDAWKY